MSLSRSTTTLLFLLANSCLAFTCLAAPKSEPWPMWEPHNPASTIEVDHSAWQNFLDAYLVTDHDSGINLVNYAGVTTHNAQMLNDYVEGLFELDPRTLNRSEQFAYWINLYNAVTVRIVLKGYPTASITKLGKGFFSFGPWDDPVGKIAGVEITLNDIEHRVLRPIWQEPRIHFLVNCASLGCPNLLPNAFTTHNVDSLLEQAARDFINHPRGVSITANTITLSSIFDWYGDDFGSNRSEVLGYIVQYLPPVQAQQLLSGNARLRYAYDWKLNETK